MQIEVTPEVLLQQLGLGTNAHELEKAQKVIDNTQEFDKFAKHIFSLNEHLAHMSAFVGLSNSHDYLKVKLNESITAPEIVDEFHEQLQHWSDKYKVDIEKVANKETYYIKGVQA